MQLLGRSVDVTSLLRQRISRLFHENLDFLFERLESTGLPRMLEHATLMRILERAHALLSKELCLNDWAMMLAEGNEAVSMTSFSSRVGTQVHTRMLSRHFESFRSDATTFSFSECLALWQHGPIQGFVGRQRCFKKTLTSASRGRVECSRMLLSDP